MSNPPSSLIAILATAVLVASGGELCAQGPVLIPPDHPAVVGGPPVAQPDFWIVSSRRSRQHTAPASPGGALDYFRAFPNQPWQWSTARQFQAGLNPAVPLCIVVHGGFTDLKAVYDEAPIITNWIRQGAGGRPLQIVFFTWPSEDTLLIVPQVDVLIRGVRASFNGLYLAQFIAGLPPELPISLVGHSFGTRVIAAGVHVLRGGTVAGQKLFRGDESRHRLRIAFLASAIDRHWILPNERYGLTLCRTERLFNIYNSNDLTLSLYPLRRPLAAPALGKTGLRGTGRERLGAAVSRYAEWDASRLVGNGHQWMHYVKRREISQAMAHIVTFDDSLISARTQVLRPVAPRPTVRYRPSAYQRDRRFAPYPSAW